MTPSTINHQTDLDAAIAAAQARLEKLQRLWELKRQCASLELYCAGLCDKPATIRAACLAVVCEHAQVTEAELRGRDRHARVVWPRFMAMRLMREFTQASQSEIGRAFARDHSSVQHALRACQARMDTDAAFALTYSRVKTEFLTVLAGTGTINDH